MILHEKTSKKPPGGNFFFRVRYDKKTDCRSGRGELMTSQQADMAIRSDTYTEEKVPPPEGFLGVFHVKSSYSHEPGVGTGTTGPGEAVFAIRIVKFKELQ